MRIAVKVLLILVAAAGVVAGVSVTNHTIFDDGARTTHDDGLR